MARIAGVDIPRDKQARIALTYIYGVGPNISREILKKAQVGEEIRMKDLTEEEVTRIRNIIEKDYEVEGDLRRNVAMNIKRLMILAPIGGFAIAEGCRSEGNGPTLTAEPEKVPRKLWAHDQKNKDENVWTRNPEVVKKSKRQRQKSGWPIFRLHSIILLSPFRTCPGMWCLGPVQVPRVLRAQEKAPRLPRR